MAKFSGVVGYAESVLVRPGVVQEQIVERRHRGDLIENSRTLREGEQVNDNLSVGNSISIVADAYAREHFFAIRYVKWAGTLWKVDNVSVQRPRLLLRLGGVYNGPRPTAPPSTP